MIKENRFSFISKRLGLVGVFAMLLASGCADKSNVVIESDTKKEEVSSTVSPEIAQPETSAISIDSKPFAVTKSSSTVETTPITKSSSEIKDGKLSYINVVGSKINGKVYALKSVHFAFDKYNLSDEMRVIAKDNYKIINPVAINNANLKIKLEGNCDEWGTDEYNYALGLKRAKIAKDALVNDGISADRIVLISYGESNPICTNKSESCWKKNRRTDYRLLP